MKAEIVVYAPTSAKTFPAWLDKLPEHTRVRSIKGLEAALLLGKRRGGTKVCLVLPRDPEDLLDLAAHYALFSGWKVVLELPDESPDALKVARPLAPRFFSFKSDNQEYLAEVVRWIADHPTGWRAESKSRPDAVTSL